MSKTGKSTSDPTVKPKNKSKGRVFYKGSKKAEESSSSSTAKGPSRGSSKKKSEAELLSKQERRHSQLVRGARLFASAPDLRAEEISHRERLRIVDFDQPIRGGLERIFRRKIEVVRKPFGSMGARRAAIGLRGDEGAPVFGEKGGKAHDQGPRQHSTQESSNHHVEGPVQGVERQRSPFQMKAGAKNFLIN